MKKRLWQSLQIALTLSVLWGLFHDAGKREAMLVAFAKADWRWLLLGWVIGLLGEIAGILRWQLLLQSQKIDASLAMVSRWFFIGLFFNVFLPGTTGGDLARLYYLWRDYPKHRQSAFLTLVADRLIGLIPLILAAAAGAFFNYQWLTQTTGTKGLFYGMLVFCGGMALVILLSFIFCRSTTQIPNWIPAHRRLESLARAWYLFAKDGRRFWLALILSMPVLFSYYAGFYCTARSVGAGASLGQIFSIMPIVTVITSLPISVAGLGLREGLFEKLLGDLCGTPHEVAALVSLLGFVIFSSFGLVGAVLYLRSPKIDRRQFEEMNASGDDSTSSIG